MQEVFAARMRRKEAAEVCSLHLVQLKGVTKAPSLFVEDEYLRLA